MPDAQEMFSSRRRSRNDLWLKNWWDWAAVGWDVRVSLQLSVAIGEQEWIKAFLACMHSGIKNQSSEGEAVGCFWWGWGTRAWRSLLCRYGCPPALPARTPSSHPRGFSNSQREDRAHSKAAYLINTQAVSFLDAWGLLKDGESKRGQVTKKE